MNIIYFFKCFISKVVLPEPGIPVNTTNFNLIPHLKRLMKKNNYSPPKNFLSTGFADMSCSSAISSSRLVTLAGSMTILVVALNAMKTALPGAAAVLTVSAALAIFTPVLKVVGKYVLGEHC